MLRYSTLLLSILLVMACDSDVEPELLIGRWQAVDMRTVDGATKNVALDRMQFEFRDEERYTFTNPYGNQEEGKYRTIMNYLYALPDGAADLEERRVEIQLLTPDSLRIRQMLAGESQLITFIKE